MDYWNHVLWSDETNITSPGSDGTKHGEEYTVRSTTTSGSCLRLSMVMGVSWFGATVHRGNHERQRDILKPPPSRTELQGGIPTRRPQPC